MAETQHALAWEMLALSLAGKRLLLPAGIGVSAKRELQQTAWASPSAPPRCRGRGFRTFCAVSEPQQVTSRDPPPTQMAAGSTVARCETCIPDVFLFWPRHLFLLFLGGIFAHENILSARTSPAFASRNSSFDAQYDLHTSIFYFWRLFRAGCDWRTARRDCTAEPRCPMWRTLPASRGSAITSTLGLRSQSLTSLLGTALLWWRKVPPVSDVM